MIKYAIIVFGLLMICRPSYALTDDEIIAQVLATPMEYRQYTVPALHESKHVSQKVRTHPDIIVWKGKKPTRIAPQLTDWAKDNLDYLPAHFYSLVMPEMWPSTDKQEKPDRNSIAMQLRGANAMVYSEDSTLKKLGGPTFKNEKTKLSKQDIDRIPQTFSALEAMYADHPNKVAQANFDSELWSAMDPELPMHKRIADPFHSLVLRLNKMGYGDKLDALVKAQGWKSADEFADKTDRALKAYRANSISPKMAVEMYKIRRSGYGPDNEDRVERSLWMYARLHEASPQDIEATAPYLRELRTTFQRQTMMTAGTMVTID